MGKVIRPARWRRPLTEEVRSMPRNPPSGGRPARELVQIGIIAAELIRRLRIENRDE
jgi:hypothetical protein